MRLVPPEPRRRWLLGSSLLSLGVLFFFSLGVPAGSGCGGAASDGELDAASGEAFDQVGKFLTTDAGGQKGLPTSVEGSSTQVWTVIQRWSDTDTPSARAAGLAWTASSGLRWDEKFSRWVKSMPRIRTENGTDTFILTTPYGKQLRMPALECSETALLLRAVFASWYGLPFFVEGRNASGRVYLGHFGFRNAAGRLSGTPNFKLAYKDSYVAGQAAPAIWPSDAALKARHLTDFDENAWLAAGAGFGAWADAALLNKRVGYFLLFLLDYFGSMNLADSSNGFHLMPGALKTGDFLLERWQKNGIGHTLVLKDVTALEAGQFGAELVSGSMPRRAPRWDGAAWSRSYFMSDITGGDGVADDGSPYYKLGGGLRRFRVAQQVSGYWTNNVPAWDVASGLSDSDYAAIKARPTQFATLLADVSPEQKVALLASQIEQARANQRQHPSSCTSRTQREAFFAELVNFGQSQNGWSHAKVDRDYRKAEDYGLPELKYGQSPTCCWNSTTPGMFDLFTKYNQAQQHSTSGCVQPTPFTKANYSKFKAYAQQVGRSAEWLDWTEDEPCTQKVNADDAPLPPAATSWCDVRDVVGSR